MTADDARKLAALLDGLSELSEETELRLCAYGATQVEIGNEVYNVRCEDGVYTASQE